MVIFISKNMLCSFIFFSSFSWILYLSRNILLIKSQLFTENVPRDKPLALLYAVSVFVTLARLKHTAVRNLMINS